MIGIYKIQSISKPERIYIGSSVRLKIREKEHFASLKYNRHHSPQLQHHYNKYGRNDLQFSIFLSNCKKEELIFLEQCFINIYDPYFNVCKIAGNTLGYKHTEATKLKMCKPLSEEHKLHLSESHLGKPSHRKDKKHSEKSLKKMSESHKRITDDDIEKIKSLHHNNYSQYKIGELFNVNPGYVNRIINNKRRSNIYNECVRS
jgi:group I intron endonuclease